MSVVAYSLSPNICNQTVNQFHEKIPGCEIQDKSTSISIEVKFEEMSESDDGDESDKHI